MKNRQKKGESGGGVSEKGRRERGRERQKGERENSNAAGFRTHLNPCLVT